MFFISSKCSGQLKVDVGMHEYVLQLQPRRGQALEADGRSLIKSSESEEIYSIPRVAPCDLPEVLRSIGWHSPQECLLHCGVIRRRVIYAQLLPLMPGAKRPNQYGFFVIFPKLHTAEGSRSR